MIRTREIAFIMFIVFVLSSYCTTTRRCRPIENKNYISSSMPTPAEFYIMQTCTESQQEEIERLHVDNFDACRGEAIRLRGLAFNFADLERMENGTENCIIYECPEFNVTSLKQNGSVFHYYSAYAKIWPSEMICIPREGLYMLTNEKLNYTEAIDKCDSFGGSLMNVITEEATRRAANVIAKSKIITNRNRLQVYVGLDDTEGEGRFFSLCGDQLVRSPWRGWAPGEPRGRYDNEDCVTIDSFEHWRVYPCNKKMPFLCEILPDGPLNLTEAYCAVLEDADEKLRCTKYFSNADDEMEFWKNDTCKRPSEGTQPDVNKRIQSDISERIQSDVIAAYKALKNFLHLAV